MQLRQTIRIASAFTIFLAIDIVLTIHALDWYVHSESQGIEVASVHQEPMYLIESSSMVTTCHVSIDTPESGAEDSEEDYDDDDSFADIIALDALSEMRRDMQTIKSYLMDAKEVAPGFETIPIEVYQQMENPRPIMPNAILQHEATVETRERENDAKSR